MLYQQWTVPGSDPHVSGEPCKPAEPHPDLFVFILLLHNIVPSGLKVKGCKSPNLNYKQKHVRNDVIILVDSDVFSLSDNFSVPMETD